MCVNRLAISRLLEAIDGERDARESANMRDAISVRALQYEGAKAAYYSSSRYIQFNDLQGQRATKLVKFWRLVTDGDTSLPA
jgi:hypothetical protein